MLYHASGVRLTPCGLHDSLCTLRAGRSTVCLSLPDATLGTGGWLKPYLTGTCTPQEAPSFAWRTNEQAQRRKGRIYRAASFKNP